MAINIPIISEFDGSGISSAVAQFKQLEGAGKKAQFAIKKAAVPAGLALAGLAVALGDATKGAIEDDAAQQLLAATIKKNTGATEAQIKANEDWISTQGKLLGVTDDDLRPSLARLVTQTHDVAKAQELAALAMDISAATGKPLASVTEALAKAAGGSTTALGKLSPELKNMMKNGLDAEGAMSVLTDTFGGAAQTAADTAQGQFKRLGVALAETKESIGAALLPAIEKLLPFLTAMGSWAQDNTGLFVAIAGAIAAIAGAVVIAGAAMKVYEAYTIIATGAQAAFNAVMALNPITLIVIAFGLLIAGLIIAYKKFDAFRNIVDAVFSAIKTGIKGGMDAITSYLGFVMGVYKAIFNGIATLWNNTIGKLSFEVPKWVPGLGGKGFDVPNIPMLAAGGIVTSPTLAMIGERGPEAVIPLSGPNAGGGLMGGGGVTINVNGGDPNAVVQALRTYMRQNGSVPIKISNAF
jgi:hypothetical protein